MPPQAATPPSTAPLALGAVVARSDSVDLANSPRFNATDVCTPPRSDAPPGCTPRDPTGAVGAFSPSIGDSADAPSSGSCRHSSSFVDTSRLMLAILEEETERFDLTLRSPMPPRP